MNNRHIKEEDLSSNLSDVLSESRTMLSLCGIIFAFLLSTSLLATGLGPVRAYLLTLSILSTAVSIMLFSMPVIYHHVQFPYEDKEKFILRSHKFIFLGLVPLGVSMYLSIALATYNLLGIYSFLLAFAVILTIPVFYKLRK